MDCAMLRARAEANCTSLLLAHAVAVSHLHVDCDLSRVEPHAAQSLMLRSAAICLLRAAAHTGHGMCNPRVSIYRGHKNGRVELLSKLLSKHVLSAEKNLAGSTLAFLFSTKYPEHLFVRRLQPASASIEHQVVRQWSFRARLTVLPPGWAPKPDESADGECIFKCLFGNQPYQASDIDVRLSPFLCLRM